MKTKGAATAKDRVENLIRVVRNQRVMLDADLARIYGVRTKRLNEAVKRNRERFPTDFAFQLVSQEDANMRSQIATSSGHGGRRYLPFAFTEHGAIMAANVLNSPRAIEMSVFVVRAFIRLREALAENRPWAAKLAEIERRLTERLDVHDQALVFILGELKKLREPNPETKRREIGFHVQNGRDSAASAASRSKRTRAEIPPPRAPGKA